MKFWFVFICLAAAAVGGFNAGKKGHHPTFSDFETPSLGEYPITDRKSFVFVVYAYNQAEWVERTLRSILEQEYDYYRIVFIDDGSKDNTFAVAKSFLSENNQENKTLLVRNEEKLGKAFCFHKAISELLDQEIVIPLFAKDWLSHSGALTRMNTVFQNPDIWVASASGLSFPSYKKLSFGIDSFYAAVFKQLQLATLQYEEKKEQNLPFYTHALDELARSKSKKISDVLFMCNSAAL